jgi:hypothetical protein
MDGKLFVLKEKTVLKLRKLKYFNRDNCFVLIVNFHNRFDNCQIQ